MFENVTLFARFIFYRSRIQMQIQMFSLLSEDPANHPMRVGPLVVVLTTSLVTAATDQMIISLQVETADASLHIQTLLSV